MEFLTDYVGFLLKLVSVALVIGFLLAALSSGKRKSQPGSLSVTKLNESYDAMKAELDHQLLDKKVLKSLAKEKKKKEKLEKKALKKAPKETEEVAKKRLYVLDFDGDIKASAVETMREEITAILSVAKPQDEVVVRLESGGGVVHGYGLAASQLQRIREANIPLTICVDKVAASGGYMMACVADKIIAAPFAILGSIGVVAQVPNVHRLLDKSLIDVELHTAGKYKRTLTMLGVNTDEGREKFKQDLEDTHGLFKRFVSSQRPQLDIEDIATGDTWYGSEAIENKLIDVVMTSDAYLVSHYENADVIQVTYKQPKGMAERLGLSFFSALEQKAVSWVGKITQSRGY
ncbi:MAG: protease SohB [Gammaproteobacteria bacterium]|nr:MULTISPECIES: protease SohB [Marinomonas]MBU1296988.1 protease SohB [Gammaproteobacteria bacterium]MBU1466228.1 protease SohB [Gammaproteobacteria bacterium]MBU2024419.1 protease SohB [Gammaproteobacteria bacterium]MBU2319678.1 protease SohB [Gammaproteobacteria bacterium]MBU2411659.1 protease SohB [Gammaproteobacteria bacterium]